MRSFSFSLLLMELLPAMALLAVGAPRLPTVSPTSRLQPPAMLMLPLPLKGAGPRLSPWSALSHRRHPNGSDIWAGARGDDAWNKP